MEYKYKLTIALITMNRADQLKHAIESCAAADLPEKTQFVVVDNASTDNTEQMIAELRGAIGYDLVYRKETENRGVGGGRNICFDLSEGEYMYIFDDDAEISEEYRGCFFTKCIEYLDRNPKVATLTTNVYDDIVGERKPAYARSMTVDGLPCVYTFHGNTAFIRCSVFESPLFMNIKYGGEEGMVSMTALDKGYVGVYMDEVCTHHMPINKWTGKNMERICIQLISNIYMMKRVLYPKVCAPLLRAAFKSRLKKNGVTDKELIKEFEAVRKEFWKNTSDVKRIKLSTVIGAYKEFGLTVF